MSKNVIFDNLEEVGYSFLAPIILKTDMGRNIQNIYYARACPMFVLSRRFWTPHFYMTMGPKTLWDFEISNFKFPAAKCRLGALLRGIHSLTIFSPPEKNGRKTGEIPLESVRLALLACIKIWNEFSYICFQ